MALSTTELDRQITEYLPQRQLMSVLPQLPALPDLVGPAGSGLVDLSETKDGALGLYREGILRSLGK